MLERVCVNCREVFSPIEGNETRDFCSDFCEGEWWGEPYEDDDYTEVHLQDYGTED